LRETGINTSVDLSRKKKGEQFKIADKKKIPFAICLGKKEIGSRSLIIRNLKTREDKEILESKVAQFIFDSLKE